MAGSLAGPTHQIITGSETSRHQGSVRLNTQQNQPRTSQQARRLTTHEVGRTHVATVVLYPARTHSRRVPATCPTSRVATAPRCGCVRWI